MIWWTKRGFLNARRRIFPYFPPTVGSALKIWAPSGTMVRRLGRSFVISKYCAFLPFHRVKSIKGSYMIMWEGIKKSMNYHHHHYSIWSQRYQYFQSFFLWGWRGKRRRRGLSPEGSPLCPALQGKYDDYWLCTIKTSKHPQNDYLNFSVGFHGFEFVFHGLLVGVHGFSFLWV